MHDHFQQINVIHKILVIKMTFQVSLQGHAFWVTNRNHDNQTRELKKQTVHAKLLWETVVTIFQTAYCTFLIVDYNLI